MIEANNILRFNNNCFIEQSKIIRCEASSNYTKLYFTNQKPMLIAKTLSACAMAINNAAFIRIHQSHLINKNFIQKIDKDGLIFLKDGTFCNISRRQKKRVIQMLAVL